MLYFSIVSRSDLSVAVSILSRYQTNPQYVHWKAIKHILRYLSGTINFGIVLGGENIQLEAFSDADWAGDRKTRKSTSVLLIWLGDSPICWSLKRQKYNALLSSESVYIALTPAAQEVIAIRHSLENIHGVKEKPTVIFEDNQAAISMVYSPKRFSSTKHIENRFHFIKSYCVPENNGEPPIQIVFCPTYKQLADFFTKILTPVSFQRQRSRLKMNTVS